MTARARLAAVYIGLVAAAGAVLTALTYLLVRSRPTTRIGLFTEGNADPPPAPPNLDAIRDETLSQLLIQSLIALGIVVILAGLVGWLVAGRLLRPIRAISQTAQRISAANLSERVPTAGKADELTALAGTINGMLDRLHRLVDSQRLFVANAAHELRTPLTTMRTAIDVTLDGKPGNAELHAMIADVSAAVDASQRTLDGLLVLARGQSGEIRREPVDLADIAAQAIEHARPEVNNITISADLHPNPVRGEPILLLRLATNLIDNALRYNHPDGEVHVRTGPGTLRVTNTGPVVRGDLSTLFRPFIRGSGARVRSGGGAGLGLSIVDAITTAHHGTITATAPATGGLDIAIRLPAGSVTSPQ